MKIILLSDKEKNKIIRRVSKITSHYNSISIHHAKGIDEVEKEKYNTIIIQLNSFYN